MPDSPSRNRRAGSGKVDFQALAEFRYQLRKYLRFSEMVTHQQGVTPLQYQLLLQVKGYPGRPWAGVAELAERLQAQHHGVVALVSRCEALGLVRRVANQIRLNRSESPIYGQVADQIEQMMIE